MKEVEVREPRALFVVVLREVLVARDVEMIIRDAWPDASILLAQTLREAAEALPADRVTAVFVQTEAETVAASCLGRRVAQDRGRVVLVGQDVVQGLPEGWLVLPFPFAGENVTALLSDVPRT